MSSYSCPEQYPEGAADLPGYWAEDRIFGGVVLFGRGESGTECQDVWFHSFRKGITNRICALTDAQESALIRFLESDHGHMTTVGDAASSLSPLPILLDRTNIRRVDLDLARPEHNVFRDRWEQRLRFRNYAHYRFFNRRRYMRDALDYPELAAQVEEHADTSG